MSGFNPLLILLSERRNKSRGFPFFSPEINYLLLWPPEQCCSASFKLQLKILPCSPVLCTILLAFSYVLLHQVVSYKQTAEIFSISHYIDLFGIKRFN